MGKYISVEDAATAFALHSPYPYEDCLRDLTDSISDGTIELADVAPVVHGTPVKKTRPIIIRRYEEVNMISEDITCRKRVCLDKINWAEYCPICGKRLCSRFTNFCPSCGAKMDKKEARTDG